MNTRIRFKAPILAGVTPIGVTLSLCLPSPLLALPQGGQVQQGQAVISQSAAQLRVDQQSQALTVDWNSFDVAQGERVQFLQPSQTAVAVNRIFDHKASDIRGRIDANGRVVLANAHGIVFGESASINVDALVAAAAELPLSAVIDGQHLLSFASARGGAIIQRGVIEAATAAHLFAQHVDNAGTIFVEGGLVQLSSAGQAVLTFDAAGYLGLAVDAAVLNNDLNFDSAVLNSGDINAGRVVMSAEVADGVFRSAVRQSGTVEATGVSIENGQIRLSAGGGELLQAGELHASRGDNGGGVRLLGDGPIRLTAGSAIKADGAVTGGDVQIGAPVLSANVSQVESIHMADGASISANGASGNGGRITLIADQSVEVAGSITASGAEGGFVELSAFDRVSSPGADISTAGSDGHAGTLLIDPGNITIGDGGDFSFSLLNGFLQENNLVITTTDNDQANPGNDIGDISFVSDGDIELLAPRRLDLLAHNNVDMPFRFGVNGAALDLNVEADLDGDGAGAFLVGGDVSTLGGKLDVSAARIEISGRIDLGSGAGNMNSQGIQRLSSTSDLNADSWVWRSETGEFTQDSGGRLSAANEIAIEASGIRGADISAGEANLNAGSQGLFIGLFNNADPGLSANRVTANSGGSAVIAMQQSADLTISANGLVSVESPADVNLVAAQPGAAAINNASSALDAETLIKTQGRLSLNGAVQHQSQARVMLASGDTSADALQIGGDISALNAGIELRSNGGVSIESGHLLQAGMDGISVEGWHPPSAATGMTAMANSPALAASAFSLAAASELRSGGPVEVRAHQVTLDGQINVLSDREIGILGDQITLGSSAYLSSVFGDIAFAGVQDFSNASSIPVSAQRFDMAAGAGMATPKSILIAADHIEVGDLQSSFTALYSAGGAGVIESLVGTEINSATLLVHALGNVNLNWTGGLVAALVNDGSFQLSSSGDIQVGDIETGLPTQGITLTGQLASQGLTIESRNLQFASDVSLNGDATLMAMVSQAITVDTDVAISTVTGKQQYQGQGGDASRAGSFTMQPPSRLVSETGDILIYASDVVVDEISTQGQTNIGSEVVEILTPIERSGDAGITVVADVIRQAAGVRLSTERGNILISDNNGAPAQSFEMAPGASIESVSGNVSVLADSMVLALISTGGNVTLDGRSGFGAINMADGGLITANALTVNNLGDVNLRSAVNQFSASIEQGSLILFNQGDLLIADSGVEADLGVTINAASPLTIDAPVLSDTDIELTAEESAGAGDDLTVNAEVNSSGGDVRLRAGDAVAIAAKVEAAAGEVSVDAGFADSDGLASTISSNAAGELAALSIALAGPGDIGSAAQPLLLNGASVTAASGGALILRNSFAGMVQVQDLLSNGALNFEQASGALMLNGRAASQGGSLTLSADELKNSGVIDSGAGLLSLMLGINGLGSDSSLGSILSTQPAQIMGGAGDDGISLSPQSELLIGAVNTGLSSAEFNASGVERWQLEGNLRDVRGPDSSTVYTALSGSDRLQVQGMVLDGVANISAGAGSDTLIMQSNALLSGSVDLGAGADQLNMAAGSQIGDGLNLGAGADELNLTAGGIVLGVADGGADADRLLGFNQDSDWVLNGDGEGTLTRAGGGAGVSPIRFAGFETLQGGNAIDRIELQSGARLSGVFDAGAGNDIFTLLSSNIDIVGGLRGGAGEDRFSGPDTALSYLFTASDVFEVSAAGSQNVVVGVELVNAGAGADAFSWNDAVMFAGDIDAGAGDDGFTLPVAAGANAVSGGAGNDRFVGLSAARYEVVGDQQVLVDGKSWTGIENWQASEAADSLIWASAGRLSGSFDLAGGDDTASFASGIGENVAALIDLGSGTDAVSVAAGLGMILQAASAELALEGTLLRGAESVSADTSAGVSAVLEADQSLVWQLTGISGEVDANDLSFDGIASVLSRGADDRLRASDNNTVIQVELGPDIAVAGGIRFIGMENIEGGAGADTINFDDNAVLSGGVSGGGGNDIFNNVGDTSVAGNIAGDDGNDTFNISGTLISGILQGGAGDDTFNFNQTTVAAVDGGVGGLDQINFISPDAGGQWDIGDQQSQLTNAAGAMLLFGVELLVDASAFAPEVSVNGGEVEINDGDRLDFVNRDASSLRFNRDANGELRLAAGDITVNDLDLQQGDVSLDVGDDGTIAGSGLRSNKLTVVNADTVDLEADVRRVDGEANTLFQLSNEGDLNIGRVVSAGVIDISSLSGSLLVGVPGVNLQGQQISLKAAGDVGTRAQPFTLNAESIVVTADGLIVAPLTIGTPSIDLFGQVAQSFTSLIAVSGIAGAVQTLLKELATVNAAIFTALLPFTADEESVRFALNWLQEAGYLRDEGLEYWVPMIVEELRAQSMSGWQEHQMSEHRFGLSGRS